MLRVALYLRYSSDLQDDATIETQREECTAKARRLDAEAVIVQEYVDTAQSGKVEARPEFQRMISDSKADPRPWDCLIVRKFDRFARDVTASRVYKTMLRRQGIKVISAREDVDTKTAHGRLLEVIIEAVAAFYSENLSMETKSGMTTNTKRGFRCGGTAPYGYKNVREPDPTTGKERTRLAIDEDEAPAVRWMFERYAAGDGLKKIVSSLTAKGFRPRKAAVWHQTTVKTILAYPTYAGTLLWRGSDGDVLQPGGCPAIVSQDLWDRAQRRRREIGVGKDVHPRQAASQHPLSGRIYCGVCGGPYIVRGKVFGKYRLCCANRRRHQCDNSNWPEEGAVVDAVREWAGRMLTAEEVEAAVREYLDTIQDDAAEKSKELCRIERAQADVTRRKGIMFRELEAGDIPRGMILERMKELDAEAARLAAQKVDVAEAIEKAQWMREVPLGSIEEILGLLRHRMATATPAELRPVFQAVGLRATVFHDRIEIEMAPDLVEGLGPKSIAEGSTCFITTIPIRGTIQIPRTGRKWFREKKNPRWNPGAGGKDSRVRKSATTGSRVIARLQHFGQEPEDRLGPVVADDGALEQVFHLRRAPSAHVSEDQDGSQGISGQHPRVAC